MTSTHKQKSSRIMGVARSVLCSNSRPAAAVYLHLPCAVVSPPSKRKRRENKKSTSQYHSSEIIISPLFFSIFRRCNFSFGGAPFSRDPAERFDLAPPKQYFFDFILNAKVAVELSTHLLHCNSPVPRHIQIITALSSYFLASEKMLFFFDKLTM